MSFQSLFEVESSNLTRTGFFMVTPGLIWSGEWRRYSPPSSRHVNTPRVLDSANLASSLIVLFRVKCSLKEELLTRLPLSGPRLGSGGLHSRFQAHGLVRQFDMKLRRLRGPSLLTHSISSTVKEKKKASMDHEILRYVARHSPPVQRTLRVGDAIPFPCPESGDWPGPCRDRRACSSPSQSAPRLLLCKQTRTTQFVFVFSTTGGQGIEQANVWSCRFRKPPSLNLSLGE